ncbi:hypothetical protein [Rhodobacter flavimaris]|uniref:hypothetical protein n=1 Tax=Rhodobacter flavimaris TaxID=2907145 RepID=UPI001F2AF7B9
MSGLAGRPTGKSNVVTLRSLLALSMLPLLAACGGTGDMQLYPIQGPIANEDPASLIPITLEADTETSGIVTFRLPKPNKSKCQGTWSSVAPKVRTKERGLSLTLRDTGGKYKNSTEDLGGVNSGEIYAVCNDGNRLQGTFISGSGTQSGTGTVTDSLGNVYKLLY